MEQASISGTLGYFMGFNRASAKNALQLITTRQIFYNTHRFLNQMKRRKKSNLFKCYKK